MKKFLIWTSLCLSLATGFISCKGDEDSYENQLAREKEAVADYIKKNNIHVISSLPPNNAWGANDYYKTREDIYIHIVDTGEVGTAVQTGVNVLARYYKIELDGDTIIRKWTTSESIEPEVIIFDSLSTTPSNGLQKAINIMKRHNAVAKIIMPSKLGTETDQEAVIPYLYTLKIKLTE